MRPWRPAHVLLIAVVAAVYSFAVVHYLVDNSKLVDGRGRATSSLCSPAKGAIHVPRIKDGSGFGGCAIAEFHVEPSITVTPVDGSSIPLLSDTLAALPLASRPPPLAS